MGPNVAKLACAPAAFYCMCARAPQSIMHAIMQSMLMQRNAVTIRGARPRRICGTQMLAMEELTWAATGPGERK